MMANLIQIYWFRVSTYPITLVATDSAVIRIQLRATNLIPNLTYYSSAIASGLSGSGISLLQVKDSSNNGAASMIDIDDNGVSDDLGEGIPTPFMYNILLPVSGLHFTASTADKNAQLQWQASNELNLKNYIIERSVNGADYTAIASVGAKNSNSSSYSVTDNIGSLNTDKVFYRLQIISNTGKYSYSNVIVVSVKNAGIKIATYPNPFTSQVNIQVPSTLKGTATVALFDGSGKKVKELKTIVQPGINYISLDDLQALSRGVYFIEITAGDKKAEAKLLK